jgi:SAM-dependent methyltransferase
MNVVETARYVWRQRVPPPIRQRVNLVRAARREAAWRKPRNLGDLNRTTPFSTWGKSRGGAIDRYYIDRFLEQHTRDIRGRVLEIAGDEYIRKFGTGVRLGEILDIKPDNPRAAYVADFAEAPNVPDNTFDCVLATQVLGWIYDFRAGIRTAHRILVPGGVALATNPGICRIAPIESKLFGEWWRFTSMSLQRSFEEVFGVGNVEVQAFGNVLSAAAFLFGLGPWDLSREQLDVRDPAFEVSIGVRAVKPA